MPNTIRQTRRPVRGGRPQQQSSGAGIGVDTYGGPAIDPTENVLSLVDVEKSHARELREIETRRQDELREADMRRLDELRVSENLHRKELADQKQLYDKQISDILTVQVKTTSELISTQLDKVTTSLSNQIMAAATQQSGLMSTLSDRIGRLEQSQSTLAGKSSVSDPATADALSRMAAGIASLSVTTTEAMNKTATATADAIAKLTITLTSLQSSESRVGGAAMGIKDTNARLLAIVMACAAVASPVVSILVTIMVMRGGR